MSSLTVVMQEADALMEGFQLNLLISFFAMLCGSALGAGLALSRRSQSRVINVPGRLTTLLARNIPSFVFLFYLAILIPTEVEFQGQWVSIPATWKAILALTIPVAAFVSDQLSLMLLPSDDARKIAPGNVFVAWSQYFIVILMASSTVSVIGVKDILAQANILIASHPQGQLTLWAYCYVALVFIASAILLNSLLYVASWLYKRYQPADETVC